VDELRQVIIRLYGPLAGGVIKSSNVTSYSFVDLDTALAFEEDATSSLLLADLDRAHWVVFVMLDIDTNRPASNALRRLLSERPDLTQEKKTILFALDAPYFLDATDISKLTAYYGLYSKQPQFLEVAARLLFKELSAPGASPVSVSGTGYVLSEAISPDVDQTIKITLYLSTLGPPEEDGETPEPPLEYRTGDTVVIQTGRIVDNNGHPVPDNSLVRFSITTTTTEGTTNQREITVLTISGEAKTNIILDTAGITQIQASIGDPSPESEIIQIDVSVGEEVTGLPTDTPSSGEGTPPANGGDPEGNGEPEPQDHTTLGDWLLTLLVTIFIGLFAYQAGALAGQVRWGVRWGLAALIGGLAVNTYLSFNLPGVTALITQYQIWGIVICTGVGALLGWGAGVLWRQFSK
jgi:beta-N-acetylhexosaminidase